VYPKVFGLSR